jgi:phosphatidylinositol alpha-1,6-mannosyltransferase
MSRILVIARVFPPQVGGSGRFLWEIYRRQAAEDFAILAGRHERAAEFDRGCPMPIQRMSLHFGDWGLGPRALRNYLAAYTRLAQLVRRERFVAVHSATLLPEGFLAWLLNRTFGTPYLSFIHGEDLAIAATSRQYSWMARKVLQGARRLIANSENTLRTLLRDWPVEPAKVTVITPGVDIESHRPAPRDDAFRTRLGWDNRQVILSAGRLERRKGHDHLIKALPAIRAAIPDVLYAIAGAGEMQDELETLAASAGVEDGVQFLGALSSDELIACYQQCDLLALPNREVNGDFEGFGMVLVEAQACGRPVLAGMSGGTAETMRDGETGRLVDCTKPENLADALIDMLSDPAKLDAMGSAGRQWSQHRFDWNVLARRAGRVFAEFAGADLRPLDGSTKGCETPERADATLLMSE